MTGTALAAVPGRVSSPLSRGPHALLRAGAQLVRDPQDALDALYGLGVEPSTGAQEAPPRTPTLEPELRAVLEQVGAGRDTLCEAPRRGRPRARDAPRARQAGAAAVTVVRGDAGRYVPRL